MDKAQVSPGEIHQGYLQQTAASEETSKEAISNRLIEKHRQLQGGQSPSNQLITPYSNG